MSKYVRLLACFQLMLLVSINVGISVYAHTCLNSGEQTILFSLNDDPCSSKDELVKVEDSNCCSHESTVVSHQEGNCCDVEQQILQSDDNYIHIGIDELVQLGHHSIFSQYYNRFFLTEDQIKSAVFKVEVVAYAPPILQGRSIHLVNKVFTI